MARTPEEDREYWRVQREREAQQRATLAAAKRAEHLAGARALVVDMEASRAAIAVMALGGTSPFDGCLLCRTPNRGMVCNNCWALHVTYLVSLQPTGRGGWDRRLMRALTDVLCGGD